MSYSTAFRVMLLICAALGFVMGVCATRIIQLTAKPERECRAVFVVMDEGTFL